MNSFIHVHFDNIFSQIMKTDSNVLKTSFIQQIGILELLPEKTDEAALFVFESDRTSRNGFAAYNTKFANIIKTESESLDSIDLTGEKWTGFIEGEIKEMTELNEAPLEGLKQELPEESKEDLEEEQRQQEQFHKDMLSNFERKHKKIAEKMEPDFDSYDEEPMNENSDYHDNSFWKVDQQHSIDDLLNEYS